MDGSLIITIMILSYKNETIEKLVNSIEYCILY